MNIRKGFNRLSVVVYTLWVLLLGIVTYFDTSSSRTNSCEALRIHKESTIPGFGPEEIEWIDAKLEAEAEAEAELAKALGYSVPDSGIVGGTVGDTDEQLKYLIRLLHAQQKGTIGPKSKAILDKMLADHPDLEYLVMNTLRVRYRDFFSNHLRPGRVAEYARKCEQTTFANALFEPFTSWLGWVLVVFGPLGLYLFLLGGGYAVGWVYRGLAEKEIRR